MAHPFTLVKETKSLTGFLAHNLPIELAYTEKSSRAGMEARRLQIFFFFIFFIIWDRKIVFLPQQIPDALTAVSI